MGGRSDDGELSLSALRLLGEVTRTSDRPDVWWACGCIARARGLSRRERRFVLIALANTLVRHRALLGLAHEVLNDAGRELENSYDVLMAKSRLAECQGHSKEAARLARTAAKSPDAPTAAELLSHSAP